MPADQERLIGPRSTAGEVALFLADLALGTFPSFKANEQDREELADRIVEAAVLWINQRHHIVSAPAPVPGEVQDAREWVLTGYKHVNGPAGVVSGPIMPAGEVVEVVPAFERDRWKDE